jgi:hypothetical protein
MSPFEIAVILALTAWAAYQQSVAKEVPRSNARFKMAIIYAAIGLTVGGFDTPSGRMGWTMIGVSLTLSFIVGLTRGRLTHLWVAEDGKIWRRGSALTVGLFIGLIVVKFSMGFLAYLWRIDDGAGIGEVLVMIAIMIAVQAQIIHDRATRLTRDAPTTVGRSPAPGSI